MAELVRRATRARHAVFSVILAVMTGSTNRVAASADYPAQPGFARLLETSFNRLPGFEDDDHLAALKALLASCRRLDDARPALRSGAQAPQIYRDLCQSLLTQGAPADRRGARAWFEQNFTPWRIEPVPGANPYDDGFLTGYYEPEVDGALQADENFSEPLRAFPAGLTPPRPGDAPPLPTRSDIDAGALGDTAPPVVFVRDGIEAFMIQVQGSARIRLRDGRLLRLTYAGRNGHPYTSIGRILVDDGSVPLNEMSLARLKQWVRDNGQRHSEAGRRLMQRNASYVFFQATDALQERDGPIGGEGVALTPMRSIAVDRALWHYGLPFWIDAVLPDASGGETAFRQLTIAQDTGSAIIGAARADIFFGSGEEAGRLAGNIRHRGVFHVLLPRNAPVQP